MVITSEDFIQALEEEEEKGKNQAAKKTQAL